MLMMRCPILCRSTLGPDTEPGVPSVLSEASSAKPKKARPTITEVAISEDAPPATAVVMLAAAEGMQRLVLEEDIHIEPADRPAATKPQMTKTIIDLDELS